MLSRLETATKDPRQANETMVRPLVAITITAITGRLPQPQLDPHTTRSRKGRRGIMMTKMRKATEDTFGKRRKKRKASPRIGIGTVIMSANETGTGSETGIETGIETEIGKATVEEVVGTSINTTSITDTTRRLRMEARTTHLPRARRTRNQTRHTAMQEQPPHLLDLMYRSMAMLCWMKRLRSLIASVQTRRWTMVYS